jgi:predicted HTH transcriptional regulator
MEYSDLSSVEKLETEGSFEDFDFEYFEEFYRKYYGEEIKSHHNSRLKLLRSLNLMKNRRLTLAGLLLFGKRIESIRPQFIIRATCFETDDFLIHRYLDSEEIIGKLIDQFQGGINFIKRNVKFPIREEIYREALFNAVIHRDYLINSSIFIYVFNNRIEIINPGILSVSEKNLNSIYCMRNPTIISFMEKDLPFLCGENLSGIDGII